jgi:putative redox protein
MIEIEYRGDLHTVSFHPSGAQIQTDAPKDNQGRGEAFSPTDLLALSLGSCMLTLMGIEARRKKLDLSGAVARVEKKMVQDPKRRIGEIVVEIRVPRRFSHDDEANLERVARDCPVHHSLSREIKQTLTFFFGVA